jgi:ABC-type bacteriocin/lantibiotic exporter with double-glycine peptidase domain
MRIAARLALLSFLVLALGAPLARAEIAVPWIAQKSASDCGRAVLASLAARRGRNIEAVYRSIRDPADALRGYSLSEMRSLGARLGVGLSVRAPGGVVITGDCSPRPAVTAHFSRIARAVANGRPYVVPIGGFGSGHYLILVGARGDQFTYLDPASPGRHTIGAAELAGRMCGFGYLALEVR